MQLARNLFLSQDRSFHRKIQEILLATQIERRFTKEQILTLYANQIYLGHGVYGFEAASEFYFSKPARQLTLPEAALIVGLPKAPVNYSPISHPDRAIKRRNLVINAMLEDGKITAQVASDARNTPLSLRVAHDPNSQSPYFVEEVRRYLENKYGTDQVHEGGLRAYTTLDMLAGFGRSALPILGRAAPERWPLVIPAPFIPPALGGCGTERPHLPPLLSGDMGPRSAIRIFLLGEAPIPRSAVFIGRSTLCSPVGRCTPAFLTGVAVRWLFIGPFARCAPAFQFGREPIPYPELVLVLARALAEAVARLITGREKLRGGGAAALLPAFPPSLEATVGLMSSE